jgi:predicted lipoprotein with Yx(FWY)xxD motif
MIRVTLLGSTLASALLLAACGSTTPASTTTTSTTLAATTTTVAPAQNLSITPAIIKSLLQAGAAYHSLPTKDFTGLAPGMTYYAFNPANNTFYASAGLVASPNSLQAQIGDQDDGGYNIFVREATATNWTVYNDGLGASQDATCPITFPPSVLAVWNWRARSCFPPL